MTAALLAPPPYPYEQQPQQDDSNTAQEAALAALVLFFASTLAIRAVTLPPRLIDQLAAAGISPRAARAAGRMALSVPLTGRTRYGAPTVPDKSTWTGFGTPDAPPVVRRVAADEPNMRARYVMNAAKRLTENLVGGTFVQGLKVERNYLQAHVQAGRNRKSAASALDDMAAKHGRFLQWRAVIDERTTPDCRALNGTIFSVDNPPGIPGAVHAQCRCTAAPVAIGPA